MISSPLPRRLPITVPAARHETVASYLARLATLNGLDGDDLWRQATLPGPTPSRRTPDPWLLSALTGRQPGHLAGALLELRDPAPAWDTFRHAPQTGCPRCDARHCGGPVFRLFPHHRYVCARHRYWIGPPDIGHPGPCLDGFPAILAAQRRHLRLVRRHGWAAAYDAVLTGFMVCGHLWENGFGAAFHPDSTLAGLLHKRSLWDMRSLVFIPPGSEQQTFSASRLFAAVYPEAIDIAAILSSPTWRKLAAGDDDQLSRFTQEIGPRIGVDGYQPRDNRDPMAHWIEQDCWRAPSQPPATFASAPGHRRPGHLAKAVTKASRDRHDNSAWWFSRNRRPGSVILHHRTVHPVVIRAWSTPMDNYTGAIWQAQRTEQRFKPRSPKRAG